ncbi:hypothetical protein QBC41DRAFT_309331 [Cercophora samala]|uniref:UBC core domain-containing protein n=1 Tax=Cercophora samala TaxID=330535 RepID=A0AA39ZNX0_9PEZI|nr:hypothetical protein QBC41DRAFT_309331 [Cercophora samala]
MTLKRFKADVVTARQKITGGGLAGILDLKDGISDGEIVLILQHPELSRKVRLHVLAQDTGDYPDSNLFMLYTEDDPPPPIEKLIKKTVDYLIGMTVYEVVLEISKQMGLAGDMSEDQYEGDVSDDDFGFQDEVDDDYGDDIFGLEGHTFRPKDKAFPERLTLTPADKLLLSRLKRDLRQVHNAGFKVGLVSNLARTSISGIVSISVRVGSLGLSEEVLEAWDLEASEYIVLLIRFDLYSSLETVIEKPVSSIPVDFRIRKCKKYKPSEQEARNAFVAASNSGLRPAQGEEGQTDQASDTDTLRKFFISNSLDQFLNESFLSIVKTRERTGYDWDRANRYYQNCLTNPDDPDLIDDPMPDARLERHPLLGDHLKDAQEGGERSFPLVAMQFAMRYIIRCTEYCLRCHQKIEAEFEALQPYVCDNPLCLFQYMSMGFGPSIEPIILNEPYVVDLLVSLCYAAVSAAYGAVPRISVPPPSVGHGAIRSLPVGLRFKVPNLLNAIGCKWRGFLHGDKLVLYENPDDIRQLAGYKWIACVTPDNIVRHGRIQEVHSPTSTALLSLCPAQSYVTLPADPAGHFQTPASPSGMPVRVFPYDTDFDDLPDSDKILTMKQILENVPSILQMESWLTSHPQCLLKDMEDISPAAASILQWIVSSNRSCIYQVDRHRYRAFPDKSRLPAGKGRDREHQRILGMDSWVQFRFAQGSPEKERQFSRALQQIASRVDFKGHPTILAWHGSNLANWHSILRTGLDFKVIACGRAFGNGVYFSPDYHTSMYYAQCGIPWPNSELQITQCMSLNEIINVPDEFVSKHPHYVVDQLDWQQCRYLFVKPKPELRLAQFPAPVPTQAPATPQLGFHLVCTKIKAGTTTPPSTDGTLPVPMRPQQQGREVKGEASAILQIPLSAIPLRIVQTAGTDAATSALSAKRARDSPELSEDEDAEDVGLLGSDTETDTQRRKRMSLGQGDRASLGLLPPAHDKAMTDFVPGTLDFSTLPHLPPPLSGNESAVKALSRELKSLQSLQAKTPLHELGWYIDFDRIENLFQWIVELHSFEPSSPLAKDMKNADIKSLVFEIRFPKAFPFDPPFVRAIRPKFLGFQQGGGGHMTVGGAMCMELLTSSGWSPVSSMESVLMQIRMALLSEDPRPARLVPVAKGQTHADYGVGEAIEAYRRAAGAHDWKIPKDFFETANGVQ